MIEQIQARIERESWNNTQTDVLDVRDLKSLADETFTHVFTNFGFLVPGDPESGLKVAREAFRVLKQGGVAVMSSWAGRSPIF